jgi:hypothetical protein
MTALHEIIGVSITGRVTAAKKKPYFRIDPELSEQCLLKGTVFFLAPVY